MVIVKMNKEELIGKMQMVYFGDRNAFNELVGYYDGLQEIIKIVREENKQLKGDIDKLIYENKQLIDRVKNLEFKLKGENNE